MPSNLRIPKAPLDGLFGRALTLYARRTYGQVPDIAHVFLHHRRMTRAVLAFERRMAALSACDPHLKAYATMASSATIGCSWCLDFGYFTAHTEGLDTAKVRQVPVWRDSTVFTPLEREVMAYAEAMSVTPLEVTDEMVTSLHEQLGSAALMELTEMISLENLRSRTNAALGLTSQGFAESCDLAPLGS
ncbi:carboxymuconolactone decarboxylase family protein [Ornithinimicrobium cryptoxanthini]|uniref:Carboxymuconolactone decarboxylase family protein n=1 Tax=Ornithinimicrobium cryptoxanthini TaxID=2934161 RepID=A0ABY4YLE0_9MICO|nr:carboxymuconolactone decarboxylase family protein [Ornithinimicrobium cryptoxanthini]USQ77528.1 carboxymuconolactone decarboxylase family protein [Ornithinimicrobium cryptoxanthini]